MLDLSSIPTDVIQARGEYSTVRAAHEDAKKELAILCGQLSATASQILRRMQPDNDEIPEGVEELISSGRQLLQKIEACTLNIESLAMQRAALKQKAWREQ
jgi:hypothetical protein